MWSNNKQSDNLLISYSIFLSQHLIELAFIISSCFITITISSFVIITLFTRVIQILCKIVAISMWHFYIGSSMPPLLRIPCSASIQCHHSEDRSFSTEYSIFLELILSLVIYLSVRYLIFLMQLVHPVGELLNLSSKALI